jgi:hypothetical protein
MKTRKLTPMAIKIVTGKIARIMFLTPMGMRVMTLIKTMAVTGDLMITSENTLKIVVCFNFSVT